MNHWHIFTDGSVHAQLKIGYAASLITSDLQQPLSTLAGQVKVKRFEETSSTKLELQCLLWALSEQLSLGVNSTLAVYTDSQNIIGLPGRKPGLEFNNYLTAAGKPLKNADLYKEFYGLTSLVKCELHKVAGHKEKRHKDRIDQIFSLVDRASRQALRAENLNFKNP